MSSKDLVLGIDIGSVSVDLAVLDHEGEILGTEYIRHKGRPMQVAAKAIEECVAEYDGRIAGFAATGSGGRLAARILKGSFINEVVAQAAAAAKLHPQVRTVIEIGGEDSKLIFLRPEERNGMAAVADFQMNTVCAAGTGSFLDQQATRLGLTIEEFGSMALKSETPPRVAGRCSVFAKSDMIHLQQKATPVEDIVAGLCFALTRNFKSTVGAAKDLQTPIAFHGGVAANPGIIRAMKSVLGLADEDLIIPKEFGCTGAIGAALVALHDGLRSPDLPALDKMRAHTDIAVDRRAKDKPLKLDRSVLPADNSCAKPDSADGKIPAYLGVDIGSISTNVVVLDANKRVLAKRYLMTAGRPIEAVRQGLLEVGQEVADLVEIRGACTTGSGRYLIADFIGADVVKNEITAQARAAAEIDPEVDTIFEIGGQDSKYISLRDGAIVDFEMNKVCAAGTGSFLEEQAEKLGISIKGQFGDLALSSTSPVNLGERCTVFMETELVRHQQAGAATEDLVSGLSYSIVRNYINRVVGTKPVGKKIFFQGGVAANRGVVAAFEMVTGQPIIVPQHHEVTGAIGCACIAMEEDKGHGSKFKGFDLTNRSYEINSFECRECSNRCEINRVVVEGERPLFYGSRCEKYDVDRRAHEVAKFPDHFAEREEMLLQPYTPLEAPLSGAPRIGIPRSLLFYELYPFWQAFFKELGCDVVISDPTSKRIIHDGAERSVAETCFPMKVSLGHVLNLLNKEIDYVFLPSVINLKLPDERMTDSFVCPYVQSFVYTVKSAVNFTAAGIKTLEPVIYLQLARKHRVKALEEVGKQLGRSRAQVARAVAAAEDNQERFLRGLQERGREVLAEVGKDERAIVVVSRAYNGCDPGANLEIPRKLNKMGVRCIPMDFLPLDTVRLPDDWKNMYWRYGQKILSAAEIVANDRRLYPLYLTNFGCGPDSFVHQFFRERLGRKPCLVIEVDEHSADAGMITRCEAYMDSIQNTDGRAIEPHVFRPLSIDKSSRRTVLVPNMSAHAYALAAAFESCGMRADVLPEPDEETLEWGRQFTSGKECFPCIVTTGDMVKFVKRPGFDRDKYAFFMGGSGGPCRFGQYNALQRMVLDQLGYPDVPIFAPNQASSFYDDMGIVGRKLLEQGWRGIIAVDLLEKCVRETRPYETEKGAADETFDRSVRLVYNAIKFQKSLVEALEQSRALFEAVPVDRTVQKPIIGYVGEFYVRANAFSNQDIIRKIEELGGEVWAAPLLEWFLYRNVRRSMRAWLACDVGLWLKNHVKDWFMRRDEHELTQVFDGFLRNLEEPSSNEVLVKASPYVHRSFEGEAIMTVGKAVDFVAKGLSGIVAVMPFTCMPGTISEALLKRVREELGEFPFLNMVYDGVEQATSQTRIEAFMHQAKQYGRKHDSADLNVALGTRPTGSLR